MMTFLHQSYFRSPCNILKECENSTGRPLFAVYTLVAEEEVTRLMYADCSLLIGSQIRRFRVAVHFTVK